MSSPGSMGPSLPPTITAEVVVAEEQPLHTPPVAMSEVVTVSSPPIIEVAAQPVTDIEAGVVPQAEQDHARAEFLSATLYKPTADAVLGLRLKEDRQGDLRISYLKETGVVFLSPLRVGDKVVSINGKSALDLDQATAVGLLKQAVGLITIIVHNTGGAAHLVETMIEKISPDAPAGLGLRRNERGSLEVSKIIVDGPFAHSLLNVSDRVLSINGVGCNRLDAQTAIDMIRSAEKHVTIVTETLHSTGVVLSSASERSQHNLTLLSAIATMEVDGRSSAELIRAMTVIEERERAQDEARQLKQHLCICTWMIILSLLILGGIILAKVKD